MVNLLARKRRGFTLVELLVVLLILGILIAIAIPLYASTMDNARTQTCQANQRIIRGAVALYHAEKGEWPDGGGENNTVNNSSDIAPYLESTPRCPSGDSLYSFSVDANGSVTVTCNVSGVTH